MIVRYFHTIRYLKPKQVFWRLFYKFYSPKINKTLVLSLRKRTVEWQLSIQKPQAKISSNQYRFLNQTHDISSPAIWNDSAIDKLWLYNLHYFNSIDDGLIERWIRENPVVVGNGWEPYPTSLRIVSWIKWQLEGSRLSATAIKSLAIQAEFLSKKVEYHLLANHLFANAKALIFAGCFFAGKKADAWLSKGLKILRAEIGEQILKDGAHFELSPMYHSIILEDMLDLINVMRVYGRAVSSEWADIVACMFVWLKKMTHPDGEVAFFNDAVFGIAASLNELQDYAERLHLKTMVSNASLPNSSGYWRLQKNDLVLIADAAAIGPNYQPGHAHADSLSFELSLGKQRILVNSGISCYGVSEARLQERGTAAHNALVIDDKNSSEVWSGFRVARRAKVFAAEFSEDSAGAKLCARHNGYKRLSGSPTHKREFELKDKELIITDEVSGEGEHDIKVYFHVHSDLTLVQINEHTIDVINKEQNKLAKFVLPQIAQVTIKDDYYHPEFGLSIANKTIVLAVRQALPVRFSVFFRKI
jgi:uncharacterized heparinase superfamily protein